MQFRDAVDRMAPDAGQMSHAHVAPAGFVDQRKPPDARFVVGKPVADFVEKTRIDFVNDFQVPRQKPRDEVHRPAFERFGQKRMIRVTEGSLRYIPGRVPTQQVFVHEQAHQFGNRQGRVRVVELDGELPVKSLERLFALEIEADHILKGA